MPFTEKYPGPIKRSISGVPCVVKCGPDSISITLEDAGDSSSLRLSSLHRPIDNAITGVTITKMIPGGFSIKGSHYTQRQEAGTGSPSGTTSEESGTKSSQRRKVKESRDFDWSTLIEHGDKPFELTPEMEDAIKRTYEYAEKHVPEEPFKKAARELERQMDQIFIDAYAEIYEAAEEQKQRRGYFGYPSHSAALWIELSEKHGPCVTCGRRTYQCLRRSHLFACVNCRMKWPDQHWEAFDCANYKPEL